MSSLRGTELGPMLGKHSLTPSHTPSLGSHILQMAKDQTGSGCPSSLSLTLCVSKLMLLAIFQQYQPEFSREELQTTSFILVCTSSGCPIAWGSDRSSWGSSWAPGPRGPLGMITVLGRAGLWTGSYRGRASSLPHLRSVSHSPSPLERWTG